MNRIRFTALAPLMFVLAFVRGLARLMPAQENTPYPGMAPLEMDR
jgi:hypothetical protein